MNSDTATVDSFGSEWAKFDHSQFDEEILERIFNDYFRVFPWTSLPPAPVGADFGCGSGRWARFVARRCETLHCVDASPQALSVARRSLEDQPHCVFHNATIEQASIPANSLDFAYSLGVLHHIPDTQRALDSCVARLKPGAPFLLYLYYALDNRPWPFRAAWRASDFVRQGICRMPPGVKNAVCDTIAATTYLPLARLARAAESLGIEVENIPLSYYRDKPFYTMRNDALDRFGTPLEKRFTQTEMREMMHRAGLRNIVFSDQPPFWCAVGYAR